MIIGGLLTLATLAVPGYLHPTWWARLTVLAGGAGGLVLGLIGCRRSIPVSWLFGMAVFGDLEIASCMTLADTDKRIAPVAFSLLSVMVALYGTRRMLAAQAGAAVLGCIALEVLPKASAIAVAQAVATAFAMIVPAFAVDAVRHRWERAVAVSQGQRDTTRAIAAAVHAVLDQDDGPGAIIDAAKTITQAQLVSLLQPDDHGDLVCTASTATQMVGLRIPINGTTSVADCYATGEPAWIDQVAGDPRMNVQLINEVEAELGVRMGSAVHYPIISGGQCLGVLAIACPIGVPTPRTHEDALELMAGEIALALSHHNLLLELQRLSAVDPLTGVANRRRWDVQIERELSRAYRDHVPLCVLMIDLDHFKRYNDLYGHHAGDDVLRSVTQSWQRRLRPSDLLCRWGGEEFAVLLPNCTLPGAHRVAEDLRTTMPPNITCSIGIAEWDHHESHFTLTHRADQHLYTAKRTGRDRVCAAAP